MTYQPPTYTADSLFVLPFDPNVMEVEQWLNSLPIIDGKRTGELILLALQALNRLDLDFLLRSEILELFRNQLVILDDYFDKQLLDAAFPLSAELKGVAQLRIRLHEQLALGFTVVCDAKAFKKLCRRKKQFAAFSIQRALISWYQVLFQTLLVYRNIEQGFWPSVYGLVLTAEEFGLYSSELEDNADEVSQHNTIEGVFKSLLLFAFAQSNCYRQRDMIQIYAVIKAFGHRSDLFAETDGISTATDFYVDLSSSNPPERLGDSRQARGEQIRFLQAQKMIKAIIELCKSLELVGRSESTRIKPTKRVLAPFIKNLGTPKKRRFKRESEDSQGSLYIGLDGLVGAMSASSEKGNQQSAGQAGAPDRVGAGEMFNPPDYEVIPLEFEGGTKVDRARGRASRSEFAAVNELLNVVYSSAKTVQIWDDCEQGAAAKGVTIELSANRVNSSACGYGFALTNGIDSILRVGELIGIPGVRSNMEVGVVRWIRAEENDTLTFGIKLFSPRSEVVMVHSANSADSPVKGLFLPEIPACRQPSSIVLPCSKFRPGDQVYLARNGNRQKFALKKLFEDTAGFGRYTL